MVGWLWDRGTKLAVTVVTLFMRDGMLGTALKSTTDLTVGMYTMCYFVLEHQGYGVYNFLYCIKDDCMFSALCENFMEFLSLS